MSSDTTSLPFGMATEDDVRQIALALPGTTEYRRPGSGDFRVTGKGFTRLRNEPEGGLVVLVVDVAEKMALLRSDPEIFFTTPFYEGRAAVLVHIAAIRFELLRELIVEAWCLKASNRMLKTLDLSGGDGPSQPVAPTSS